MTDNAQHADLKRMWSGWISLMLFVLLIPLSNWVIVNLGVVCPPGEPCLVPVLPGLWAPSTVLLAGFSLVLRDVVHHCLGWRWLPSFSERCSRVLFPSLRSWLHR